MSEYNSAYTGKQIDEAVRKVLNGDVGGGGVDVIAQAGQLIRVKEVDEEGRPTKWEAADDMPWVEQSAEGEIVHKLPAKFLPNMEKVENVLLDETSAESYTDSTFGDAWRIDTVPVLTVGETYTVIYNGTPFKCVCYPAPEGLFASPDAVVMGNFAVIGGENTGEPFAMMMSVDNQMFAIIDLGGFAEVKVEIRGDAIYKFDQRVLPDGVPYCIDNGVVDLLPATTVQFANMQAMIAASIPMVIGEAYTVNWNGTEYECVAMDGGVVAAGGIAVGNGEPLGMNGNGEPFIIGSAEGKGTLIYALDGSSEATFSVNGRSRSIRKLDPLCLPDGAVGVTLFDVNVETIDFSAGVYTADKTFGEILGAIKSGNKIVRVLHNESGDVQIVLNLVRYGSSSVTFSARYLYDADGGFTENTVFIRYDNTVGFYRS